MVEEKGLPNQVADKIGEYVMKHKRGAESRKLLETLSDSSSELSQVAIAREGLQDMKQLLEYCEVVGVLDRVRRRRRRERSPLVLAFFLSRFVLISA